MENAKKFNLEEITNRAKNMNIEDLKDSVKSSYNNEASPEEIEKIILGLCEEKETTPDIVLTALAILLQQGATSVKTPGQKGAIVKGKRIEVNDIRRIAKKSALKRSDISLRQIARALKQEIVDILLTMGDCAPDGNLSKLMKLELKNVTKTEAIWASDFQTYNEKCPERVRNWLVNNYMQKFRYK
ncbi:MAG: hypothetical protein HC854_14990 [Flavobacterium sp.]|nr:hypothetical protein [Flavobacterium sp.]